MKVKDLIEKLGEYNPEALLTVIAHNKGEEFTLTYGGTSDGEGITKADTTGVQFYVDSLNQSEAVEEAPPAPVAPKPRETGMSTSSIHAN